MAGKKQKPSRGRIVLYTLTYDDMTRANERSRPPRDRNYEGFDHTAGQVLPMIVTSVHEGRRIRAGVPQRQRDAVRQPGARGRGRGRVALAAPRPEQLPTLITMHSTTEVSDVYCRTRSVHRPGPDGRHLSHRSRFAVCATDLERNRRPDRRQQGRQLNDKASHWRCGHADGAKQEDRCAGAPVRRPCEASSGTMRCGLDRIIAETNSAIS